MEIARGMKPTVERRMFPGYVRVQAGMTDQVWHVIRWRLKVIGLVGREKSPMAPPGTEVEEILNRVGATAVKLRPKTILGVADRGKIADGPFREFTGTAQELNPERASINVGLSVFGQPMAVVLDPMQIETA